MAPAGFQKSSLALSGTGLAQRKSGKINQMRVDSRLGAMLALTIQVAIIS
jgi:hypothetical protein